MRVFEYTLSTVPNVCPYATVKLRKTVEAKTAVKMEKRVNVFCLFELVLTCLYLRIDKTFTHNTTPFGRDNCVSVVLIYAVIPYAKIIVLEFKVIKGANYFTYLFTAHVCVYHRCLWATVPKQFLYVSYICSAF